MTGYLLITSHGSWEKLRSARQWVFARRQAILDELPGKLAAVYLTAHGFYSSFAGLITFTGPVDESAEPGLYPFRMPIRLDAVLASPIPVERLRDELSFFPKGSNWGGVLQGQPVKRIPEDDFETIKAAVTQGALIQREAK